ncbi:ABC transporter permease [Saliphagus sp. LR7]|uniref:ABC transporter permease n=1 Tax=Saliphagus sp. LR7 TaxID=2282654 RepID=UPI00130026BB|nr:ABC transporter permease [Saliphagus sp. LR7]
MSPSNVEEEEVVSDPQSTFNVTADADISRKERLLIFLDESILAPTKILWKDYRARIGTAILLVYLLAGTVGVRLVDQPRASDGPLLQPPFQDTAFILGTDQVGKGIFASLIHSTPPILKMMFAGAVFSTAMAVVWGVVSGYKGGTWDRLMMTVADIVMTIPGLPVIVVLAAVITPENPYFIGLLLSISSWAGFSRSLRSQVLTLRQESYVEASRILGMRNRTIMFKDILPNLMPLIMVHFVTGARGVIFRAIGLYFIGVLPFDSVNWGVMMNLAYQDGAIFDPGKYHWFIAPTVTVLLLSLGLILFGQGMDRIFNPRIRAKHAKHTSDQNTEEL